MNTILFVDDDRATRELVSKILDRSGYRTLLAGSVDEALQTLSSGPLPDLIVSDVAMPERDGLDLLREVRRTTWGRRLPFIFLSARPMFSYLAEAQEAQADAFIAKPISVAALREAVGRFLSDGGR